MYIPQNIEKGAAQGLLGKLYGQALCCTVMILEKDYIVRRIDPNTPRRLPRRPPRRRRSRGRLPLGLLAGAAALVVLVVVLVLIFTSKGDKEETPDDLSSLPSQASVFSQPVEVDSAPESQADPGPSMPEQEAPDGEPEDFDSMVVVGDTGYACYKFSQEQAIAYIELVSYGASILPESVTLYDMIVPTSLDVLLPESYITEYEIDSSDQRKAIEEYIYPSIQNLSEEVKTVSLFDPLRMHCNEYIYLRSDRCWTQLGAYYAYVEFCKAAGLTPTDLEDFEERNYEGYLGDFYNMTASDAMGSNPDTITAYHSSADASFSYTSQDGERGENWPVIQNGDSYSSSMLNLIFMAGGQAYSEIVNHDLDDGSTCLVVADSMGSTFTPFLVDHYQYIYMIDYRTYSGSVPDLVEETGAEDVILLNSITMTSDEDLISDLSTVF